jgi:hypothetical protein
MANFATGRKAIAECDRCGMQFLLKKLKTEIIKTKKYNLKVCPECWDPDHPQLLLGMQPIVEAIALREPRIDTTYITAGLNADGNPTGGSRNIQWGWYPVGGSSNFDAVLTQNYLVSTTNVGTVTVTVS